jgi:hypothetical protein
VINDEEQKMDPLSPFHQFRYQSDSQLFNSDFLYGFVYTPSHPPFLLNNIYYFFIKINLFNKKLA